MKAASSAACRYSTALLAWEAAEKIARLSSFSTLSQLAMLAAWSCRTSGVMCRSAQRKADPSSATNSEPNYTNGVVQDGFLVFVSIVGATGFELKPSMIARCEIAS